jgi:glycosyltransferase involved in cell wall biosynthesis
VIHEKEVCLFMITLVHPGCNSNVRAVAQAFESEGKLDALFTSISGWKGGGLVRQYPTIPLRKIHSKATREVFRLLSKKMGMNSLLKHESGICSTDRVWREVDDWASKRIPASSKLVYAYEDAALHSFKVAKSRGMKAIYDLPIGYWRASLEIYQKEIDHFPEFAPLIQGLMDSPEKRERKDEELELADRVHVCSRFVKSTLIRFGYPEEKIRVMQFGAPNIPSQGPKPKILKNRALKVLFVGRMDQRKGIGYLLKAMEHFDPKEVEFHMVGAKPSSMNVLNLYWSRVHDHGTLDQQKVWKLMGECDLFVFPTLFEGQALVVLEAMACGLPVVVTPNAGADRVVRDGKDGFIIPIRSMESIVEKISWAKNNTEELQTMGESAVNRSREFTWESYQAEILRSTMELMS